MAKFLTLLLFVCLTSGAFGVLFFEHDNHQGRYFRAPAGWAGGHCNGLPGWMNDQATSINTEGQCIIAFEHAGCQGRGERIFPGSCCHANIGDIGFGDSISSYKSC